jgi:hypothetical protein
MPQIRDPRPLLDTKFTKTTKITSTLFPDRSLWTL